MTATTKKILIALGLAGLVGCSGVVFLLFKAGKVVIRAEGTALYSAVGAWSRIQEYARAEGKTNYIAEADRNVTLLESEIASWRSSAESVGLDIAEFERMRKTAYETTDRNIKSGQNPLAHLDRP
jgi:hypothetical protein